MTNPLPSDSAPLESSVFVDDAKTAHDSSRDALTDDAASPVSTDSPSPSDVPSPLCLPDGAGDVLEGLIATWLERDQEGGPAYLARQAMKAGYAFRIRDEQRAHEANAKSLRSWLAHNPNWFSYSAPFLTDDPKRAKALADCLYENREKFVYKNQFPPEETEERDKPRPTGTK